jgi:hypothetical protein
MMDFQIYADIVRQERIEEAERERLIRAARAGQKNRHSLLGRLISLVKGAVAGAEKSKNESTPPLGLRKREPAV